MSNKTANENLVRIINSLKNTIVKFFSNLGRTTADTLGWSAIVVLHASTIPGLLAFKAGISDSLPPIEQVSLLWFALLLYFIRSAIIKDMLNVITIGIGFAIQALLLGLIFFQ